MKRRVYRAVAYYPDGSSIQRHFLTKRSRDGWAKQRREGYPETMVSGFLDEPLPAIPPALRVEVADSEPVVFPQVVAPGEEVLLELGQPVSFTHVLHRQDATEETSFSRLWTASPAEGEGFIMGWRTLCDGKIEQIRDTDGYGNFYYSHSEWQASRYFRAYIIATHLRHKPSFVLPEHLRSRSIA